MRLRLTVQRHGLPPMQVLWTVGTVRPGYVAGGAGVTVSQLLEQINEIIPLESSDWGLEDYAVEVQGFECLHFSELTEVLKEDDEVSLRPLQTSDLRVRKLSGRHQISSDGKHLIDGVAFGRPFLRRADRPPLAIPPRKRRRLTYDEDDNSDTESQYNHRQAVVRTVSEGVEDETSEDSQGEELQLDDETIEELAKELNNFGGYLAQAAQGKGDEFMKAFGNSQKRLTRSRRPSKGLGLEGESLAGLVDENGRPFPGEYSNPLMDLFGADDPVQAGSSMNARKHKRRKQSLGSRVRARMTGLRSSTSPERVSRRSSNDSTKSVRFQDPASRTPATILENRDTEESDDEDFLPDDNADVETEQSDKENAEPGDDTTESNGLPSSESESDSTISSESESESSESSSLLSSTTSSSDSDTEPVSKKRKRTKDAKTPKKQEHQTGEPEEADIAPENGSEQPIILTKQTVDEPRPIQEGVSSISGGTKRTKNKSKHTEGPSEETVSGSPVDVKNQPMKMKPPGQGLQKTSKRNERRRVSKKIESLKRLGLLPPNASRQDYSTWLECEGNAKEHDTNTQAEEPKLHVVDVAENIEAKKQILLDSIASGGIEVEDANSGEATADVKGRQNETSTKIVSDAGSTGNSAMPQPDNEKNQPTLETPKRRAKLDLPSSRRLVFGSLGIRTPKTKEDESETRLKLIKDARPIKKIHGPKENDATENNAVMSLEENESWKERITLKAVECGHDEIELSTPPFPFFQRWDPQQRRQITDNTRNQGSRSSKKRKRNQKQYYEENSIHLLHQTQESSKESSKESSIEQFGQITTDPEYNQEESGLYEQQQEVSHIESDQYQVAINEQLMRDADGISASALGEPDGGEDLPDLPEDMSTCIPLTEDTCIPGAIVAFKEVEMSRMTYWQPKVSEYRTAIINQLLEDGNIQMTLAQRDQSRDAKLYDEDTGERLYSKFEMPGFDENEAGDGNGVIERLFAELVLPMLISAAKPQQDQASDKRSLKSNGIPTSLEHVGVVTTAEELPLPSQHSLADESNETTLAGEYRDDNDDYRKDASMIMRKNGFESSDGVNHGEELRLPQSSVSREVPASTEETGRSKALSPGFNGFSSSPRNEKSSNNEFSLLIQDESPTLPSVIVESPVDVPAEGARISSPQADLATGFTADEGYSLHSKIEDDDTTWDEPEQLPELSKSRIRAETEPVSKLSNSRRTISQASRVSKSQPRDFEINRVSLDGADSDSDFPTLETIFSNTQRSLSSPLSEDEEPLPSHRTEPKGKLPFSQKKSQISKLPVWPASEEDEDVKYVPPTSSQAPIKSQIVDLTLSSDPVDPTSIEYDGFGSTLPSGPGWVRKARDHRGGKKNGIGQGRKIRSM